METSVSSSFPVRQLRAQVTELEAAVLVVLDQPKKKAVHRIRTATRRIEAELDLLNALTVRRPELRALAGRSRPEQKARKALGRLRKGAGKVRDLDVQRLLVKQAAGSSRKQEVQADAKDLRRWMKHRRNQLAEALQYELSAHLDQLAPRLEALLEVFGDAEDLHLTELQLIRATEAWFRERVREIRPETAADQELHTIRKCAKLARYIAESGGASMPRAQAVAAEFEDLQNLGGQWHDLLTLSALARKHLSRKSELVRRLARQESRLREEFRAKLATSERVQIRGD